MVDDADAGPLETRTRAAVAALGDLENVQGPLAELAFALAQRMDAGAKGMAAAAVGRELRETLRALTEVADAGDATAELLAALGNPVMPAAVRDTPTT